jgi:hypothetical protein
MIRMAVEAGQIPFQEAIDFFRSKVNLPTAKWDDLLRQAQVRAFSVAGMMRDDWLAEIRAAIDKAQVSGAGLKAFQDTFDTFVKRTGWQYYSRGETEEARSAWRAKLIYKTNMRVSYMAGRYKQLTDPDVLKYRPYWRYKHSGNEHPRRLHLSWNGLVLLATDPAWKVMFPPNGFGCGCDVEALSRRQLRALGKTGPDQAPNLSPWQETDPRTGQEETRYIGIDRGWEYNPGMEWLEGVVPKELTKPLPPAIGPRLAQTLPAMPPPEPVEPGRLLQAGQSAETYVDAFLGEFGLARNQSMAYRDKSGGIISITQSLFEARDTEGTVLGLKSDKFGRGPYTLLFADAIRDPDEIWIDWVPVRSGIVLRRAYIKRFILPRSKDVMFVRFEWTKDGWIAVTGFEARQGYVDDFRAGSLVYARK